MQLWVTVKQNLLEIFYSLWSSISVFRHKPTDHYFSDADIAEFFQLHSKNGRVPLDDQTWRDLLIDDYFRVLSKDCSIFAQQALYRRLRLGLSLTQHEQQRPYLQFHLADQECSAQLHQVCLHLRRVDTEIASLLFSNAKMPQSPVWFPVARLVPFLMIIALLGAISAMLVPVPSTFSKLAFFSCFPISLALFALQLHYRETIRVWNYSMHSLRQMLGTCSLLGQRKDLLLYEFSQHWAFASKITGKLTRLSSPLEGTRDYLDWFMLGNLKCYFSDAKVVEENIQFIRDSFIRCAEFEADLAIARHLRQHDDYCWAEFTQTEKLSFDLVMHPLLLNALPLTLASRENTKATSIFLSGQNGVGKSTLLRTIGINLVLARSFGFCYAQSAQLPCCPIFASMQNEDSLLDGESLYISELRRARELMDTLEREHETEHAIYIIDEIFRGTNYLESISAASAVLHRLSLHGSVFVSSHHVVLARLLHVRFLSYFLQRDGEAQLQLVLGVLSKTNGISLLSEYGFDQAIEADANKTLAWLTQYLSHPNEDVDLYS